MFPDGSGIPNPATVTPFVQDASYPVDLQFGPDGNLYYVDVATGSIHRISYFAGNQPPVAVATGAPTSGATPLVVNFNGSGSSDPDGSIASYAWDLDGDGQYDDSTAQNPSRTYTTAGTYVVRLRVTDNLGAPDVSDPITITAGSSAPTAVIDQPAPSFTWRAGDVIAFSGHGTDPEDGAIPASGLRWDVTLQHCTSPGNCHSHFVESFPGVASGSFSAPDHEYPSFLELKLTATDSSSISSSTTIALNPRTVTLTMQSVPSGLSLVVNNNPAQATPFTATVVEGSINTISAPSPQTLGATSYAFSSWSDGGGQTHTVTANSSGTYTATYTPQGGGGPSYSSSVLADSPLAYWRLGESSGSTAADASGNGRTGSYLNTPTLGAGGALTLGLEHGGRLQRHRRVPERPVRCGAQPGAGDGRGLGLPDGRTRHLPLGRDEPRLRTRQRARLHPLRLVSQHMAALARKRRLGRRLRAADRLEPVDAPRRHLRRHDRAPVRERRARSVRRRERLPAEHRPPASHRERRDRQDRPAVLPARPSRRSRRLRQRTLGDARAGALCGRLERWRRQPAAERRRCRLSDERRSAADGQLQRLGLERPRRNDHRLRVGPRRRRRVRRLERAVAELPVHERRHLQRPPAGDRRRRSAGHFRSGHRSRSRAAADRATAPPSSRTPRSPTGGWASRAAAPQRMRAETAAPART